MKFTIFAVFIALCAMIFMAQADGDVCSQPMEIGLCKGRQRRYYHNGASGRCELFYYGGCQGNSNNFLTIEECRARCEQ